MSSLHPFILLDICIKVGHNQRMNSWAMAKNKPQEFRSQLLPTYNRQKYINIHSREIYSIMLPYIYFTVNACVTSSWLWMYPWLNRENANIRKLMICNSSNTLYYSGLGLHITVIFVVDQSVHFIAWTKTCRFQSSKWLLWTTYSSKSPKPNNRVI